MRQNSAPTHVRYTKAGTAYRLDGCIDGEINATKTILAFAHGVGLGKDIWQPQIDAFSTQHQSVSYDLLGHGDSPLPAQNATLSHYIMQIEELRAHLGIQQMAVIGHSTGALISIGYALRYPQYVSHIAPLNAVYCRPEAAQQAALERVQDARKYGPSKQLDVTMQRWFGDTPLSDEHIAKRETLRRYLQQANTEGYATTYRVFVESDRLYVGKLAQLNCPCLFLTGELDSNSTPDMSIAMANEVNGAHCAIIENSRHMTPYVDAEQTNHVLLDFLQGEQ